MGGGGGGVRGGEKEGRGERGREGKTERDEESPLLRCVLLCGSIGSKGADSYERELYGRTKAEIHVFAPSLDSALQVPMLSPVSLSLQAPP